MLECGINYLKWWAVIVIPTLIIGLVWTAVVLIKDRMWWCPDTITIKCDKCGGDALVGITFHEDFFLPKYKIR